jgi:hypothetical protein
MAIRPKTERRFDTSSPVARYWLAQCEGFRVKGPMNGTVEEVVGSVDLQSAEALVVRSAWRRHTIPVTAVDVVVPAARLIVVDRRRGEAALASDHARTHAVADAGSRAASSVAGAVAHNGPPVARFLMDVGVALALLIAGALSAVAGFVAATGSRLHAGVRARRQAAAERRRRASRVAAPDRPDERRLSRAAVLGVDRRDRRARVNSPTH